MARQKRTSTIVDRANLRASSLASIDPALELSDTLTLAAYRAAIAAVKELNDGYNTALSELDGKLDDLQRAEKDLNELSANMLAGVAVKFGRDSNEVEMAGGTRLSERKKRARKAETSSSSTSSSSRSSSSSSS